MRRQKVARPAAACTELNAAASDGALLRGQRRWFAAIDDTTNLGAVAKRHTFNNIHEFFMKYGA